VSRDSGRAWTLALPYDKPPLSLNQRLHWAPKANLTKRLRTDVAVLARAHKIPALDRALVELHFAPRDQRRYDSDNIMASLKPAVDGLVDAGVLTDDDHHRVRTMTVIDQPTRTQRGRLRLVIRELPGE